MKQFSFAFILFLFWLISCTKDQPKVPSPIITAIPYPMDSIIPNTPYFGKYSIPEDNPITVQGVELGRMLFYEKMLSKDNTMSCANCHKQEFAFTDGEAVSVGVDGIAGSRSSMSIQNLIWDKDFFWDGRSKSLEEQALIPIEDPIELHQSLDDAIEKLKNSEIYPVKFKNAFGDNEITADRIAKAIAQFERILISNNSKYDKYVRGEVQFTQEELRGMELFFLHASGPPLRAANCGDCHFAPTFNGRGDFRNNGVDSVVVDYGLELITGDPFDRGKMKVPTLRNLSYTAPYMHNGKFKTIREVLDFYNKNGLKNHVNVDVNMQISFNGTDSTSLGLTDEEIELVITFLKTLDDEEFITNEKFSNPF